MNCVWWFIVKSVSELSHCLRVYTLFVTTCVRCVKECESYTEGGFVGDMHVISNYWRKNVWMSFFLLNTITARTIEFIPAWVSFAFYSNVFTVPTLFYLTTKCEIFGFWEAFVVLQFSSIHSSTTSHVFLREVPLQAVS